jgi:hypothetical protein
VQRAFCGDPALIRLRILIRIQQKLDREDPATLGQYRTNRTSEHCSELPRIQHTIVFVHHQIHFSRLV